MIRTIENSAIETPDSLLAALDRGESLPAHWYTDPSITAREIEVLKLLVAARSNREIARTLGIEERTVKAHIAKLMRKVGVENRIALSIYAVTNSIIKPVSE